MVDSDLQIPISASVRHVHLSQPHVAQLFGDGHKLRPLKDLTQPGQFACEEMVALHGPKRAIENVRVLGPTRGVTQVEISRTDEFTLGIDAPVRPSGQLDETPGLLLVGPAGRVTLSMGVIQAQRHIHMSPRDAERFGVRHRDWVMVRVGGERGIIFDDVMVRVSPHYKLDMHLDTDEANAADLGMGAYGVLIKGPTLLQPEPND